jgi:mannosyl-oligosaccharide alpha-1,3-glucosidase
MLDLNSIDSQVWYDYDTFARVDGGVVSVNTPLSKIPVFLKGGSILPRRDRIRRAANLGLKDPYTLIVAVDAKVNSKLFCF